MARGAKLGGVTQHKARIPSEVCDRIDFLMDAIRSRIVDGAFLRAEARSGTPDANLVTEQDVLRSATEVLPRTSAELERLLTETVSRDARVRTRSRRIA